MSSHVNVDFPFAGMIDLCGGNGNRVAQWKKEWDLCEQVRPRVKCSVTEFRVLMRGCVGGGVARKDGERWNVGLGEGGWRLAGEEECERRVWECALTWR